jgi:hypothetical protein
LSLAATSIAGDAIGVGDYHPENVRMTSTAGDVVHGAGSRHSLWIPTARGTAGCAGSRCDVLGTCWLQPRGGRPHVPTGEFQLTDVHVILGTDSRRLSIELGGLVGGFRAPRPSCWTSVEDFRQRRTRQTLMTSQKVTINDLHWTRTISNETVRMGSAHWAQVLLPFKA